MGRMTKLLEGYKTAPLEGVEFTDRYGGNAPPWLRGCRGHCEAMGFYPLQVQSRPGGLLPVTGLTANRLEYERARREGRVQELDSDGWAWITCEDCDGKGVVSKAEAFRRLPGAWAKCFREFNSMPNARDGLLEKWGPIHTRFWGVRWYAVETVRAFTWDPPEVDRGEA